MTVGPAYASWSRKKVVRLRLTALRRSSGHLSRTQPMLVSSSQLLTDRLVENQS